MTPDDTEYEAYEHLLKSRHHAKKAKKKFADGSKGESVSDNVVRWAEKSVDLSDRYLRTGDDQ